MGRLLVSGVAAVANFEWGTLSRLETWSSWLWFGTMRSGSEAREEKPFMKSKNPSKHRDPRGAGSSGGRSGTNGRAMTLDFVQFRIEAFNREQGGGVIVRKDRNGYTLVREKSWIRSLGFNPGKKQADTRCSTGVPTPIAGGLSACTAERSCRSMKPSTSSPPIPWSASGTRAPTPVAQHSGRLRSHCRRPRAPKR